MPHNTRIVNVFSSTLPMFNTDEEANEFHRALGRMVAYAMHGIGQDPESTNQLVNLHIAPDGEITGAYYRATPMYERNPDGTIKKACEETYTIDNMVSKLRTERAFVMGAVKHGDKYGFHS